MLSHLEVIPNFCQYKGPNIILTRVYSMLKTLERCIEGDILRTGKFIFSKKEKQTFAKAESFCKELGLELPMPDSIAENDEQRFQQITKADQF